VGPFLKAAESTGVEGSKYFGVRYIFAQISPNLSKTLLCDFLLQNFSHKDHEDLFDVTSIRRGLHLFFSKRWRHFLQSSTLDAIFPGSSEILPKYF